MEIKQLEELNKTKSLQITKLETETEELNKKIEELEKELKKINMEKIELRDANLTLRGKIDALTEVISILNETPERVYIKLSDNDEY